MDNVARVRCLTAVILSSCSATWSPQGSSCPLVVLKQYKAGGLNRKPEAVTSQHFSAKRNNGHFAHVRQPVMSLGCYRRVLQTLSLYISSLIKYISNIDSTKKMFNYFKNIFIEQGQMLPCWVWMRGVSKMNSLTHVHRAWSRQWPDVQFISQYYLWHI